MIAPRPVERGDGAAWFRIELPSDPAILPWLSHGLRGFLRATGWRRRDAFRMELAVNEAVDNAIRHGNRGDSSAVTRLNVSDDGQELVVEVQDQGAGFQLEAVQPLSERNLALAEGGRGVALMQRLMDEVRVETRDGRNCVRMKKTRPDAQALRKAG